jgi:hypothetical protein
VPPETAPVSWTKKSYSLSDYANQDVYVGIQCVTNNGFIFMIDDISVSSSLGIEDTGSGPWFNVYPNPASNHLNLRISGKTDPPIEVKLVSLTGQLVNSWLFLTPQEKITLDVSSFPEGLYLLKTLSGDGESIRKISIIH